VILGIVSEVAPFIESNAAILPEVPLRKTRVSFRFDSTEVRHVTFVIDRSGHSLIPMRWGVESGIWNEATMGNGGWDESLTREARDSIVARVLDSRRLLIRLTLTTDETVTGEFRFGSDTRRVLRDILGGCGWEVP